MINISDLSFESTENDIQQILEYREKIKLRFSREIDRLFYTPNPNLTSLNSKKILEKEKEKLKNKLNKNFDTDIDPLIRNAIRGFYLLFNKDLIQAFDEKFNITDDLENFTNSYIKYNLLRNATNSRIFNLHFAGFTFKLVLNIKNEITIKKAFFENKDKIMEILINNRLDYFKNIIYSSEIKNHLIIIKTLYDAKQKLSKRNRSEFIFFKNEILKIGKIPLNLYLFKSLLQEIIDICELHDVNVMTPQIKKFLK